MNVNRILIFSGIFLMGTLWVGMGVGTNASEQKPEQKGKEVQTVTTVKSCENAKLPKPPIAAKKPTKIVMHGETLIDNYDWLKDGKSPDVLKYLQAENKYAEEISKKYKPLREKIYKEIISRTKETDANVPTREGDYYYYTKTEAGKQYEIYCRKKGNLGAKEEIILDLNQLANNYNYLRLKKIKISDDGNLLAFSIDTKGKLYYTMFIKDLKTKKIFPEKIENVWALEWDSDNKTIFYTLTNSKNRSYQLYRHKLGFKNDKLIYEEKDDRFFLELKRSRDKKYLFLNAEASLTQEVFYLDASDSEGKLKTIAHRKEGIIYDVDHRDHYFYIRTNDKGKNFRIIRTPINNLNKKYWEELIPYNPNAYIWKLMLFSNFFVTFEEENAYYHIRIGDFSSGKSYRLPFKESVYFVGLGENPEFYTDTIRLEYSSFITPTKIFDYNMRKKEFKLLKQLKIKGGYNSNLYKSERLFATATDGTRVPISLVYKKSIKKNGKNPMYLIGYGGYGYSFDITFNPNIFSLVDRGGIYAMAHVRGGGEMGKKWHDQGRRLNKMNTFTDFIAVAEYLIQNGYTSSEHLAIRGMSAGGLLVGAVVNMRPDLFKVATLHVPAVDVIGRLRDKSIPLTSLIIDEYGDPQIKKHFENIKSYSPYQNISFQKYPSMLVTSSFNDRQVPFWIPTKYVAKLRAYKKDNNPLVFKINMTGSHLGSSGRYNKIRESADNSAFILWQLGLLN